MKTDKNKKKIIMTSIGIVLLVAALLGASYAYFSASLANGSTTSVSVTAGTLDSLVFNTGNPITLIANQDNFTSGKGNLTGSTTASATLTANNKATSAVTYTYNVYLNISENTYTKTGDSAELVLRILDPNTGNLVSIPSLTQVTVGGVTGYDITESSGTLTLASNYSISTSTTKTDTWQISITYVNLSYDQSDNVGASFTGTIEITKGQSLMASLDFNNICTQGQALNSCITSAYISDGVSNLYYHSSGKTVTAEDGSYRFVGGDGSYRTEHYIKSSNNSYYLADSSQSEAFIEELISYDLVLLNGTDLTLLLNGSQYNISSGINTFANSLYNKGYINIVQGVYIPAQYNSGTDSDPVIDLDDPNELLTAIGLLTSNSLATLNGNTLTVNNQQYDLTDDNEKEQLFSDLMALGYIDRRQYGYVPAEYNGGIDSGYYSESDVSDFLALLVEDHLIRVSGQTAEIINRYTYDISSSEGVESALNTLINKGYVGTHSVLPGVNNYVCFGTSDTHCDYNYLYRIIGVIPTTLSDGTTVQNLVKLIKAEPADVSNFGGFYGSDCSRSSSTAYYNGPQSSDFIICNWNNSDNKIHINDSDVYNLWRLSLINNTYLNDKYLNNHLGNTWNSKIANVQWKVAGNNGNTLFGYNSNTSQYEGTAKTVYTNEIVSPNAGTYGNNESTYNAKVGLMYLSDFIYAGTDGYNGTAVWGSQDGVFTIVGNSNNWMHNGVKEWTITRHSDPNNVFVVYDSGIIFVAASTGTSGGTNNVRPVFYLNNNITYQSGSGSYADPIRIS